MPLRRRPPTRIVRSLMLVGAIVALLALAAPALAGWSTPATLPVPSGASGWYEDNVTVAPLPDGTVVVAVNAADGGTRPAVAVLANGTWATSFLDASGADDPMVSWDGTGKAVAVWRKPNGSGRTETFAARRETNGTWTSEGLITGTMHANYKLQGISRGPNGDIAVGLCPGRAPHVVRRVDGVWGAPVQVPASGDLAGIDCDDSRSLFSVAQDGVGGTWIRAQVGSSPATMRVAYLNPSGTWEQQQNLTAGGSSSLNQQLAVAGDGTPVALWSTSAGAVTAREHAAGAWSSPQIVDSVGTTTQGGVRLAVAATTSPVVAGGWRNSTNCTFDPMYGSVCDHAARGAVRTGGAWSAVSALTSTPAANVAAPVPAVDAFGGAHQLLRTGNAVSAVDPAGTDTVLAATGVAQVRGLGSDSRGRLVAVWSTTGQAYATSVLTQAPGVPVGVTATAVSATAIDVAWSAPAADGGSAVTGYVVTTVPATTTCASVAGTSCQLTGLDPGTAYAITVAAVSAVGTGTAAAQATATTSAAPAPDDPPAPADQPAPAAVAVAPAAGPAAAKPARLRMLASRSVGGRTIVLRMQAPGPGRLSAVGTPVGADRAARAGRSACRATRRVSRAGPVAIGCTLTRAAYAAAARPGGLRVRVVATFRGTDGATAQVARIVRVEAPVQGPSGVTG